MMPCRPLTGPSGSSRGTDDEDGWPHRQLRLGFDTRALLLETVVLILEGGEEVVIHAMPARKKYLDLLPWSDRACALAGDVRRCRDGRLFGSPFEAFGGRRRVAGPSMRTGLANPQALAVGMGTMRSSTSFGSTRMTRGPLR